MVQIRVEELMKKREAMVEQHRQATAAVEQTRGAIFMIDELIKDITADANGAAEATNDVEATSSSERSVPA